MLCEVFAKKLQPFTLKIRICFCKHRFLAKTSFAKTPLAKAVEAKIAHNGWVYEKVCLDEL